MPETGRPYRALVDDPRCLASAEVVPGQMKRCVRAVGHSEQHLWVEAVRADGRFDIARWDDDKHVTLVTASDPTGEVRP